MAVEEERRSGPARPLRAYFGHHKCGTSWIGEVLQRLCLDLGLSNWGTDNPGPFPATGITGWAEANRIDVVTFTNAEASWIPSRPAFRGFHVVRDPRDMCVSAYYSHRNSHPTDGWPELEQVRAHLRRVDPDEGLAFEIEYLHPTFEAMESWDYRHPDILELSFETLIAEPVERWIEILEFLGLAGSVSHAEEEGERPPPRRHVIGEKVRRRLGFPPSGRTLSPAHVRAVVEHHSFAVMSGGRRPGESDPSSHYRIGVAGQWRSWFTPAHAELFRRRYPSLLGALGYADDWHLLSGPADELAV